MYKNFKKMFALMMKDLVWDVRNEIRLRRIEKTFLCITIMSNDSTVEFKVMSMTK